MHIAHCTLCTLFSLCTASPPYAPLLVSHDLSFMQSTQSMHSMQSMHILNPPSRRQEPLFSPSPFSFSFLFSAPYLLLSVLVFPQLQQPDKSHITHPTSHIHVPMSDDKVGKRIVRVAVCSCYFLFQSSRFSQNPDLSLLRWSS